MKELKAELQSLADVKRCQIEELQVSIYISALKKAREILLLEIECCESMGEVEKLLREYGRET